MFVFFKQKTAYEMRISDWSSDVCSSDLLRPGRPIAYTELSEHIRTPAPERSIRFQGKGVGLARQRDSPVCVRTYASGLRGRDTCHVVAPYPDRKHVV